MFWSMMIWFKFGSHVTPKQLNPLSFGSHLAHHEMLESIMIWPKFGSHVTPKCFNTWSFSSHLAHHKNRWIHDLLAHIWLLTRSLAISLGHLQMLQAIRKLFTFSASPTILTSHWMTRKYRNPKWFLLHLAPRHCWRCPRKTLHMSSHRCWGVRAVAECICQVDRPASIFSYTEVYGHAHMHARHSLL